MGDRSHAKVHVFVEQLLDDPMTEMVMRADGIQRLDANTLLSRACLASYPDPRDSIEPASGYRRGVGIVLFNDSGKVWVGRRNDISEPAWQLPQGAIDPDETPLEAAFRELREELGTDAVEFLGEIDDWLRYDLPEELIARTWGGNWRGQDQRWIAMRFLDEDGQIDIKTAHPEFCDWYWADLRDVPTLAVPFKRQIYEEIAARFAAFSWPREEKSAPTQS